MKSTVAQVPAALCELQGYRCYWHGARAYSGVGLHIRRDAFAEEPRFFHPSFDFETRVVAVEKLYVNGEWVEATGGATFEVKNPATGEVVARAVRIARDVAKRRAVCVYSHIVETR